MIQKRKNDPERRNDFHQEQHFIESNAIILILYWLAHPDVVVLKSCVFCIFQQILPRWSLSFISIIKVSEYYKCSIFTRIVVKAWFFSPLHNTYLSGRGETIKCSPLDSVTFPAPHMVIVRTKNQNVPPFWTSDAGQSVRCPSRDFFCIETKGRGEQPGGRARRMWAYKQ